MRVLKFGGSSVATPEAVRRVLSILQEYIKNKEKITVVLSAFGGTTNALLEMGERAVNADKYYKVLAASFLNRHIKATQELLYGDLKRAVIKKLIENHRELENLLEQIFNKGVFSPQQRDSILSFGERNSCYIFTHVLIENNIPAQYLDARQIITTNNEFGAAAVNLAKTYSNIRKYYTSQNKLLVVTGFIASESNGLTTTLGRGGSDYTAAILAAGLDAEGVDIWTDVNGVLTADPRKVSNASTISTMTYGEAKEMANFGAKVIYPPTIQPTFSKNIPIYIKNTFNPSFEGTHISNNETYQDATIKGISATDDIVIFSLFLRNASNMLRINNRLVTLLTKENIDVFFLTQNQSSLNINILTTKIYTKKIEKLINQLFEETINSKLIKAVKRITNQTVFAIIGRNFQKYPNLQNEILRLGERKNINILTIGQDNLKLCFTIKTNKANVTQILTELHDFLFSSARIEEQEGAIEICPQVP